MRLSFRPNRVMPRESGASSTPGTIVGYDLTESSGLMDCPLSRAMTMEKRCFYHAAMGREMHPAAANRSLPGRRQHAGEQVRRIIRHAARLHVRGHPEKVLHRDERFGRTRRQGGEQ